MKSIPATRLADGESENHGDTEAAVNDSLRVPYRSACIEVKEVDKRRVNVNRSESARVIGHPVVPAAMHLQTKTTTLLV